MRRSQTYRALCATAAASALLLAAPPPTGSQTTPPAAATAQEQELDRLRQEGAQAYNKADFAAAEKAFLAGLEKAQGLKDERRTARFLNNLGAVYERLGQYDRALDRHARALALKEKLGNGQDIASSLDNLGIVYYDLGQLDKVLEFQTRALALREKLGNEQHIATSLNNLGNVYDSLGQSDKAREYHARALALNEKLGNEQDIAMSLNNLGSVYYGLGQLDKAREHYARALALRQKLGNEQHIATSLGNLGNIYNRLGRYDRARDYQARALALNEKLGNEQQIATSLNNLGSVYERLGQLDKALDHLDRALTLRGKLGNGQDIATSLNNLGSVYEKRGRLGEAEDAYAQAARHFEAVGEQVEDASQLGAFQQANQGGLYARHARLWVRRGRPLAALAVAERGRAQGLARQAAHNRADLARLTSKDDAARWKTASDALTAADRLVQAAQQRLGQDTSADETAVRAQLAGAKQRHEAAERGLSLLRSGLYRRYPEYKRLRGAEPPTAGQLTALARKNPDTLYLEWAVVDDKSALLFALSHHDGLKVFTLPAGDKVLAKFAGEWRASLTAPGERRASQRAAALKLAAGEPNEAKALSRLLLPPLEKAGLLRPGRHKRLVLVPDGPLLDLPLAALLDASGRRLLERFAVSSSVSLGVLTWPPSGRRPTATLLCAADPAGKAGERFPGGVQAAALRDDDAPLPSAREEARQVAGLFPGAVGMAGPQAREAQVKQQMGRFALLHFATHGKLMTSGLRSWLKLAPEPLDSSENGLLEAREIVGLPLSARLAVLSACESGRGQKSGGEGLLGLAWAFRAAGCPSTVASQWRVSDAATRHLMVTFYRGIKAGKPKDEALRAAMLLVRKEPGHRHPYYWAAFQVIGDTAPLQLPQPVTSAR